MGFWTSLLGRKTSQGTEDNNRKSNNTKVNKPSRSALASSKLQRLLALSFFQEGELVQGFNLLRQISNNQMYSYQERSLAVQMMGDIFLGYTDGSKDFAVKYLFTGSEPYLPIISETSVTQHIWDGLRQLYLHSYKLSPCSIAAYRIAETYILQTSKLKDISKQKRQITNAIQWWERGNALCNNLSQPTILNDPQEVIAKGYAFRLRGSVSSALYALAKKCEYKREALESFEKSRKLLIEILDDKELRVGRSLLRQELLWTDIYYVQFLLFYSDTAREDITDFNLVGEITGLYRFSTKGFQKQIARLSYPMAPSQKELQDHLQFLSGFNDAVDSFLQKVVMGGEEHTT